MDTPLIKNEAEALILVLLILAVPVVLFYLYTVPSRRRYVEQRSSRPAREAAAEQWISEYQAETERQQAEAAGRFEAVFGKSGTRSPPDGNDPLGDKLGTLRDPATRRRVIADLAISVISLAVIAGFIAVALWMGQWWGPGLARRPVATARGSVRIGRRPLDIERAAPETGRGST